MSDDHHRTPRFLTRNQQLTAWIMLAIAMGSIIAHLIHHADQYLP